MSYRAIRIHHQEAHDIEFVRSEVNFGARQLYPPAIWIECDRANGDWHLRCTFRSTVAANGIANPRCQLPYTKWFRDIVIGPGLEGLYGVVFTFANSKHENRK